GGRKGRRRRRKKKTKKETGSGERTGSTGGERGSRRGATIDGNLGDGKSICVEKPKKNIKKARTHQHRPRQQRSPAHMYTRPMRPGGAPPVPCPCARLSRVPFVPLAAPPYSSRSTRPGSNTRSRRRSETRRGSTNTRPIPRTQLRRPPVRGLPVPRCPFAVLVLVLVVDVDVELGIDREEGLCGKGRVGGSACARVRRRSRHSNSNSRSSKHSSRHAQSSSSSQLLLKPYNRPCILLVDVLLRRADGRGADSALPLRRDKSYPRLRPIPRQMRRHAHARARLKAREEEQARGRGGEEGRALSSRTLAGASTSGTCWCQKCTDKG
ncbi:hypothetical protein B0H13DRAFT_691055, partial [Mycena leptocephala]